MRPMILENSPVNDKTHRDVPQRHLSGNTMSEIVEIATFAADQLYARSKGKSSEGATISFRDFEDWYKAGGYSVVPWLELLHLSKWNEAELGTVSAENSPSKDDRKVKAEAVVGALQGDEESPAPPSAKKPRPSGLDTKTEMPNFFYGTRTVIASRPNGQVTGNVRLHGLQCTERWYSGERQIVPLH